MLARGADRAMPRAVARAMASTVARVMARAEAVARRGRKAAKVGVRPAAKVGVVALLAASEGRCVCMCARQVQYSTARSWASRDSEMRELKEEEGWGVVVRSVVPVRF